MIFYNYVYRGPFEYDKFVLNAFQLLNEATMLQEELTEQEASSILKQERAVNELFESILTANMPEKILELLLVTE